jgi:hypothetical protein
LPGTLKTVTARLANALQHARARGGDLRTNTVAGEDRDQGVQDLVSSKRQIWSSCCCR